MSQYFEGFKHKWHSADLKKFRFNVEVVGMNSDIKDVPKQLQKELSLQTTSSDSASVKEPNEIEKSLSLKVKGSDIPHIKSIVKKHKTDQLKISFDENSCQITCEGPQSIVNKFKMDIEDFIDSDIYIDMTEDEYAGLLYLSREERWKLHLKSQSYDKGRAVFKVNQSVNPEDVSQCVLSKIHRLQQLSTAEVLPPQNSVQNFDVLESQFESSEGILCFLSLDKSKIIIKAEGYEKAQQAKYRIEVNLGMVQQGGGRRNRVIASSDVGPRPVARQTSVEESAVQDGKRFRTKEGISIYVYCAGIGNLKVETLVNAANKDLQHGGGIAYHISNAAGYALEKECDDYIRNKGPIPVGSCCTSTAGKLPYNFIIHAVGPMWHSYKHDRKGECLDDLKSTILSALKMATDNGLKSIALPSISSGIFGVPKELCAQQYLEAVKTYSHQYQMSAITEIHFIDKDRAMCNLIQKTFEKELGSGQKM